MTIRWQRPSNGHYVYQSKDMLWEITRNDNGMFAPRPEWVVWKNGASIFEGLFTLR